MRILSSANKRWIKRWAAMALAMTMLLSCACALAEDQMVFAYHYASREEGISLLLGNDAYYAGLTQNDLDFKMQKKGATLEEYQAFARQQVMDFSEEEKRLLEESMAKIEATIAEYDLQFPPLEEIVFVRTTQAEENGSSGYTHGTQIYFGGDLFAALASENMEIVERGMSLLWHEIFHCLTRCNPDFRAAMYEFIHFTVEEQDFPLPPSVLEYFITNPDVERHNSWATFYIDGKAIDCFTALVTTRHFEEEGDSFFYCMTTALVPVDGSDIYYTPEQASNFYDVFGMNTGYVIDPEECMADNFSYAMCYGLNNPSLEGFSSPEIIRGVLDYLTEK